MTVRTSRAAVASLALGCVALVSWVFAALHASPNPNPVFVLLTGLLGPVVWVTAITLCLREKNTRKDIGLALLGVPLPSRPTS